MLYLVTNRHIANKDFFNIIEESIKGGIDKIILREKDLCTTKLLELSIEVKKITDKYNIPLIINSNLKVAQEINAYGFHCGYEDFISNKYKYDGVIGVSIHSIDEAIICEKKGANYVLAGHIFETNCKKGLPPKGLNFINELKKTISIPIIGIGGINETNINMILNTKISGVAVMSHIMASMNPYIDTKILKNHIQLIFGGDNHEQF
ncbi:thiamine-phosphate pyrophosphorylase [Keratinibaculum paraultunense]|uniref:Thiamine-phosphate synthase n=1 Tax=Keratinibaculum paraultunense TaxID=1278232 RepID=A0A4R3KY50_9FIRM|nr:thiamine phosphate synthase [Keratinibaculum paraultunense]QQY80235.1 thiamine phosphate synthase [Keratinibaculum paraultunense]TCS90748.1 thiamine-phosphate pyrophosphorylase [Keratinibaculum paraultunense]